MIFILATTFEEKYYYSHVTNEGTEASGANPAQEHTVNKWTRQGLNLDQADTQTAFSHIKISLILVYCSKKYDEKYKALMSK